MNDMAPVQPDQLPAPEKAYGFVNPLTPEWITMWAHLSADSLNDGNPACHDPETWEAWQYMGSVWGEGTWTHVFRHRRHPKTKRREVRSLAATKGWAP